MFAGLFVVVAGLERAVLSPERLAAITALGLHHMPTLGLATAALSNLVSNVPAVMLLLPHLQGAGSAQAGVTLALVSTFAGNLLLVGSIANLIVVQRARAKGVEIGFWTYLKVGAPLTVLTILVALAML